jgi:hypothetical protein
MSPIDSNSNQQPPISRIYCLAKAHVSHTELHEYVHGYVPWPELLCPGVYSFLHEYCTAGSWPERPETVF